MRTLSEIFKDINEASCKMHSLEDELRKLQEACWHRQLSKELFSSCAGHIRKWQVCIFCGKEFNIEYDDDDDDPERELCIQDDEGI